MKWFPHPVPAYRRCLTIVTYAVDGHHINNHQAVTTSTSTRVDSVDPDSDWGPQLKSSVPTGLLQTTQLRLHTNIKWVPHPAPAYNRCLETFMCCCGWAYGGINHQAAIVTCVGPHWGSLVS